MSLRTVAHPLALGTFLGSVVVAVVVELQAPWSGRWPWIVAWGIAAYLAVSVVAIRLKVGDRKADERPAPRPLPGPEPNPSAQVALTREALRHLNSPALGECALAMNLRHTIRAFSRSAQDPAQPGTPVSRTLALRAALLACIDRLRNAPGPGQAESETLRFTILYEEYVLRRSIASIATRHSISERTAHRYRQDATRVLADELARQEEILHRLDDAGPATGA